MAVAVLVLGPQGLRRTLEKRVQLMSPRMYRRLRVYPDTENLFLTNIGSYLSVIPPDPISRYVPKGASFWAFDST